MMSAKLLNFSKFSDISYVGKCRNGDVAVWARGHFQYLGERESDRKPAKFGIFEDAVE